MTSDTLPGQVELVVNMTINAAKSGVYADKLESAGLHMIKGSPGPGHLGVAGFAFGGKSQDYMRRYGNRVVVVLMTPETYLRRSREHFRMAGVAVCRGMGASKRKVLGMPVYNLVPTR